MTILQAVGLSQDMDIGQHIRRIGEEKLDGSGNKRYPARR